MSRIRLYDGPLTGNQVAGLACAELPGAICGLTRAEYVARADGICKWTTHRFYAAVAGLDTAELEDLAVWSEAAARISWDALARLHALPPPEADRALLDEDYSLREQELDVLLQLAAAASAGDTARVERLMDERIRLAHQRALDAPGHLPWECPVALGA